MPLSGGQPILRAGRHPLGRTLNPALQAAQKLRVEPATCKARGPRCRASRVFAGPAAVCSSCTGGHATFFIAPDGGRHGDYSRGKQVTDARAEERGWVRHAGAEKHRYVYILGNRTQRRHRLAQLRLAAQPYPKGGLSA